MRKNLTISALLGYKHIGVFLVSALVLACPAFSQNAGTKVEAENGMVVSASAEASKVGLQILQSGGNAVDAAVAVGFALAVTYPSAGNLGGGLYFVVRMADGRTAAIDARETAPAAATRDMYLDQDGNVIDGLSLTGPIAAGVPGSIDGLLTAERLFGTMPLDSLLAPAISLADNGFPLHPRAANLFNLYRDEFSRFPASLQKFTPADGGRFRAGDIWKQPELAETLQLIARTGRDGFYTGETADLMVEGSQQHGGIITHSDLESYQCIVRRALSGTFKDYTVLSMPPSSSGGVVLIEMLNILKQFPLDRYRRDSFEIVHLVAEAMKRAFSDRAEYLGDPDFTNVPVGRLVSDAYAASIAESILMSRATPSDSIKPGLGQLREGDNTTHFNVVDRWGNAVSVTTTLNSSFGSKFVVEGTGVLLNNEMDDFSAKPGVPNQFGLVGNEANSIEPGKRMLSSMTPVIVVKDNSPVLITGSPGGSRIITTVLHVILNVLQFGMNIDQAVNLPRYHHQWLPDVIQYEEDAISHDTRLRLEQAGHTLEEVSDFGRAEGIVLYKKRITGCSDSRGYGAAYGY